MNHTINELVGETKQSLSTLERTADNLLMRYRIASEQINTDQDPRQGPLSLLQELNSDLKELVEKFSIFNFENVPKSNAETITAIAESEERIIGRL